MERGSMVKEDPGTGQAAHTDKARFFFGTIPATEAELDARLNELQLFLQTLRREGFEDFHALATRLIPPLLHLGFHQGAVPADYPSRSRTSGERWRALWLRSADRVLQAESQRRVEG